MTAASRYIDHMRTIWPRWDLPELARHYADDGVGGEPGLDSHFGAWRDSFLAEHFPVTSERDEPDDRGVRRLGRDRLRILLYLFYPFVYGRDWSSLNEDRHDRVALPAPSARAQQETRIEVFLTHLNNLQTHFASMVGTPHSVTLHDPALLVSIAMHEGSVTGPFTGSVASSVFEGRNGEYLCVS